MYRILIKYKSVLDKIFWYEYIDENGNPYTTGNLDELTEKLKQLDKEFGWENIRIVTDITYSIKAQIDGNIELMSEQEVTDMFNTAYNKIF